MGVLLCIPPDIKQEGLYDVKYNMIQCQHMTGISLATIAWGFAGGVLPTFFWLWVWLRNDHKPEPRGLITLAFIGGALVVPLVIPVQQFIHHWIGQYSNTVVAIAGVEEFAKFLMVAILVFPTRFVEEPIDYGVYLVTGALGFAALENMLFLLNPLQDGNIALTLTAGNLRFLGATVVHATSAAIIGISLGIVFYKNHIYKFFFGLVGIIGATALHALFNFFIMKDTDISIISTISILWVVGIFVAFAFRKLSQLYIPYHY